MKEIVALICALALAKADPVRTNVASYDKANPQHARLICATEHSDGVLIAHEVCNKFYQCWNGEPVVRDCYGNLQYNPFTEVCDWPHTIECGDRILPEDEISSGSESGDSDNGGLDNSGPSTCKCNPAEASEICAATGSDGILIAHENCCNFYKCSYGKPVSISCPEGLLYNPYTEQCDWPENVECGDRVIPEPGTGGENNGNGGSGSENSENGGSENGPSGTCNCNPAEAPEICAAEGSDGILVASENCCQYYKCDNGRPVSMACFAGLLYNPYTEQCDWPENVECGDRVIPEPGTGGENNGNGGSDNGNSGNGGSGNGGSENGPSGTCNCNPAEAPEICAAEGSDGILVASENCCQYYKCDNGRPVSMACFAGLLYNPYTEQCDWPENVECGDRVIPEPGAGGDNNGNGSSDNGNSENGNSGNGGSGNGGSENGPSGTCNCNPAEAPEICAAEGSDGVLVASENCCQYYKCDNGRPVSMACFAGLLYNPYTEQCDWPENVECGDRVIPEPGAGGDNNGNGSSDNGNSENGNSGNGGSGNGGSENGPSGTCNCNPAEAPEICAAEGSDGILVASENCCQYYKCDNGRPVSMSCFAGLLYNPYTEQCDWPENVECGDRVIPEPGTGGENNGNGGSDNGNSGNGGSGNGGSENGPSGTCNCNPAEAPEICAAEGSDGILVASENCCQYYKCDNGRPVSMACFAGLLYNPYTEQCDWPKNVECGDRVIPEPGAGGDNNGNGSSDNGNSENGNSGNGGSGNGGSENGPSGTCNCNPAEAPEICAAEGSDGILVASENCCQYYKCDNGRPVSMSCFAGHLYNPYTEQCDWPENVECGDRVIPEPGTGGENNGNGGSDNGNSGNGGSGNGGSENGPSGTCNCNPAEAPEICAAEGSDGILIASENCCQYYKCDNGRPVSMACFAGLLYNPYTEQCDWPENVECGDRVIPEPDAGGDNNGNGSSDNGNSENGNSGNGGSGNGGSENGPSGTCNCNPAEAPEICAAEGSDGILVASENCCQYYKCDNGRPVSMACFAGLLYNPYTEQCDWPENVECGDRVIPEPGAGGDNNGNGSSDNGNSENGNSGNGGSGNGGSENGPPGTCNCNPAEAPEICAAEGSDGILVASENCCQYYKCDNGRPVSMACFAGLLYNPYTEQCDWPENVECGDRVIPEPGTGGENNGNGGSDNGNSGNGGSGNGGSENGPSGTCNCNPAEAPEICAAEGSDGILVASENCCQYYKCDNGRPVSMACFAGLLYNPYTEQCDWPENVECGDRVIPEPGAGGDNNGNGSSDNGNSENGNSGNGGSGNGGSENGPSGTCNCNPAEAPEICAAEGSDGILVASENCCQYYKCDNGRPVSMACFAGLLYNPYTEQCDWPENVECGDRVIPQQVSGGDSNENGGDSNGNGSNDNGVSDNDNSENGGSDNNGGSITCNCNPAEAPEVCAAYGSDDAFVAHEYCNQFYTCVGGKPVTMSCPGSLLYNPYVEACDWPENVKCGNRVIPEPDSVEDNNGNGDSVNNGGSDNGNSDNGNSGTCNCNPAEAPNICAADGSDGVLIAHENCCKFYKCEKGKPVSVACHMGLLYNPYTEQCDWPENVKCGDRVIVETEIESIEENEGSNNGDLSNESSENTSSGNIGSEMDNQNPANAETICATDGSEGVFVAHEDCKSYYTCSKGKPITMTCSGNTLYNPSTQRCDWPQNVICEERPKPEIIDIESANENHNENESDGILPDVITTCASFGSEGKLMPHEAKCNHYYVCVEDKPVLMICTGSLMFNHLTNRCDWPQNVDCNARYTPFYEL